MEHSFDIEIAKKYGIPCAVLLKNIFFWIEKNRANNKNFYDDNFWTYNSKKAFAELFPYLNERQIDYALKKLIDEGVLITGNYNKVAYDRTLWYAITKKGYSILQNCEMDETKLRNGSNNIVEPIPDINTNNKLTNNNKDKKGRKSANSFDALIDNYLNNLLVGESEKEEIRTLLQDWLKVRKAKRAAMTDRAIELNLQKLDEMAKESGLNVADYLKEIICRGWQAFYAINNFSKTQTRKQDNSIDLIAEIYNELED